MKSILPAATLAISMLLGGCSLDTPADTPQLPALQLQVTQNQSLTHLQWSAVNVTGFEEYILLQSPSEIPNTPEPELSAEVAVAGRFDDISATSFSTVNSLFKTQTCYKLYTKVNDRFLYSPTVCIDAPVTLINGFYDRIGYNKADNDVVMFDRVNSKFSVYDLDNEALINTIQGIQLFFPILDVTSQAGQSYVFAFDQNVNRVLKFTLPQLTLSAEKEFFDGYTAAEADGDFVFMASQNSSKSFQVLDQNSFNLKDNRSGFTGFRQIASFPGDTTTVLEIWEAGTRRFTIDSLGKIISDETFLRGISQVQSQNTGDVNDQYFIGGRFSTIVDRNANVITSLNEGINSFAFFNRFSEDNSKAIVLFSEQVGFLLGIYDISALPAKTLLKEYSMPNANYADVFLHDNIIHIVGVDMSTNLQTFILKIPVE